MTSPRSPYLQGAQGCTVKSEIKFCGDSMEKKEIPHVDDAFTQRYLGNKEYLEIIYTSNELKHVP